MLDLDSAVDFRLLMTCSVSALISQKVFIKSLCKSQFPRKSVNLFFILVIVKDKLTGLCGIDFCKTTL